MQKSLDIQYAPFHHSPPLTASPPLSPIYPTHPHHPTVSINKLVSASSPLDLSVHQRRLIKVFTPPPRESSAEVHKTSGMERHVMNCQWCEFAFICPSTPTNIPWFLTCVRIYTVRPRVFRMGQDSIDDLLLPLHHPAHTYPILL